LRLLTRAALLQVDHRRLNIATLPVWGFDRGILVSWNGAVDLRRGLWLGFTGTDLPARPMRGSASRRTLECASAQNGHRLQPPSRSRHYHRMPSKQTHARSTVLRELFLLRALGASLRRPRKLGRRSLPRSVPPPPDVFALRHHQRDSAAPLASDKRP
jgi:hypothetical protein